MNRDFCLRGVALDGQVRFFAATTAELVEEARVRHGLGILATAALGRTLTAAVLMGMGLKGKDQLTVTFKGDGALGTVMARANSLGEVKGYCDHPEEELPLKENGKIDVAGGIGFGTLYVTKDMGLKDPYVGMVPIVSGEIGEDLTEYYYSSEQTLSAVGLGVLVDADRKVLSAGGFIIQLMPGAAEELGLLLDQRVQELPPLSAYFREHTPQELLEHFFQEDGYQILETAEPRFACGCSKENYGTALLSLGKKELEELAVEDVEVVCQFCNEHYLFTPEEIQGLLKEQEE